jgi:hypothetical protein
VLACLAVLGVTALLGVVVASLTGLPGLILYAAVAALLLGVATVRGRRLLRPAPLPPGRTCTCCTTSQHDPVQVI